MKLKKTFLIILVFVPLFSLSQEMVAGNNSGSMKPDKPVSIKNSQHIAEQSIKSSSMEDINVHSAINKEPPASLDVYLDLHKRWKFSHQNISRSDS